VRRRWPGWHHVDKWPVQRAALVFRKDRKMQMRSAFLTCFVMLTGSAAVSCAGTENSSGSGRGAVTADGSSASGSSGSGGFATGGAPSASGDAKSTGGHDNGSETGARGPTDAGTDGASACSIDPATRFADACPTAGCPAGTICANEIGGVHGGGGSYCAPIPDTCKTTPTCACLGSCVCGPGVVMPEQTCTDLPGGKAISCDNGIR